MADYYLQFSEMVSNLTQDERVWLERQLEIVVVIGDREYPEDNLPSDLSPDQAEWIGCQAYRDMKEYEPDLDVGAGFDYLFEESQSGGSVDLWLHADENGGVARVAHFVQKFLQTFRPDQCWTMTYATTCSKPRVGDFGGGGVCVSASEIKWTDAHSFVEEERAAFEAAAVRGESQS